MEDLSGREVGPFRLVAAIDEAATGRVYEAYGPDDDRVALKIVPNELCRAPRPGAGQALEALTHPHIQGVVGSGRVNGFSYIATPFGPPASTLADRRPPLPIEELGRLAKQVASALDHAHERGVVHGGLTLKSLRIDEDGDVIVADFGVGGIVDMPTRLSIGGPVAGIPLYMAPELALGREPDRRSDVYSLAAMLFELATGAPPYRAETPVLVGMKHAGAPVPSARALAPELPETFDRALTKGLSKRPEDRFERASDLVQAMLVPGVPVDAPAPMVAEPLAQSRRRWVAPTAFALFIWATLPVMPTLRRLVMNTVGEWFITVFSTVFFSLIAAVALRQLVWKMRVREENHYWRLFFVVQAYALALLIYGHEPIEQVHLIYYGALGILIFRAIVPPERPGRAHVYAVILVCALGWVDEGIQWVLNVYHLPITESLAATFDTTRESVATFFHKRYYDLRDVRLNATAGLLGQLALAWWRALPRPGAL